MFEIQMHLEESVLQVLFWMSTSFQTTSRHLLISILDELNKAGHQVTVIKKKVDNETEELPDELLGRNIRCISISTKGSSKSNLSARYLKDIVYIHKCKKYLGEKYDAVFVQSNNVAGFVIKAIRRKMPYSSITYNVQDIFPYNALYSGSIKKKGILFKSLAAIQRYGYLHSDHIITISQDMKDTLVEAGISENKVDVIYNWSYQNELYDNLDLTTVSQILNKNVFNVVYAGNIGVMQNVDILIETASEMKEDPTIWFHIIGNGVYKEELETKAGEKGIKNISFWPMQPPELAPIIYSAADVNVIPLVKDVYRTALPSKTATCLACGKPVIFAIGRDSKFGKLVYEETRCPVIDSDDAKGMVEEIIRIKEKQTQMNPSTFFLQHMQKKENSHLYASIITTGDNAK